MAFTKGVSGNTHGRPRKGKEKKRDVVAIFAAIMHKKDVAEYLDNLPTGKKTTRVKALFEVVWSEALKKKSYKHQKLLMNFISDYAIGKPATIGETKDLMSDERDFVFDNIGVVSREELEADLQKYRPNYVKLN
jgi:hypothetical protein